MAAIALPLKLPALPPGLALRWPGGRAGADDSPVRLTLRRRRLLAPLASGRIGDLADAYVRGDLDIDGSLGDVMAVAAALVGDPVQRGAGTRLPGLAAPLRWLAQARSHWLHRPGRDARHVQFHYDVGDAFYALWLDPLRVYSCAYYPQPDAPLADAQQAKLDLVCRKLLLQPGQRFLDIGAGWGGLLLWAARHYRVRALGITLSRHQHAHVQQLVDAAGLRGQVEVRPQDWRDLRDATGFDRIASVGMFEHVGRAQMPHYVRALHRLLRPGGLLLNHAIAAGGLDNRQLGGGMGDFIERHIFPGGELLHVADTTRGLAAGGLELLDAENLRPHYARTLWAWSDNLERQRAAAAALTSEATVRAYRLYLAGAALCFERGWLALYQLLASRPDDGDGEGRPAVRGWATRSDHPFTRRHMLDAPG